MLGLFPHLGKWHDFLLLWLDNISVEVTFSFFIHGRLDCFRIVAVGSNTAVNTLVQTSLQDRDVSLFSCVHRRGLDASRGSSTSGFRETSTLFSWRLHRFTLPPAVQEGPLFSTSVVVLVTSYLFDSGHSGGCGLIEVWFVFPCWLWLVVVSIFPGASWCGWPPAFTCPPLWGCQ